MNNVMNDISENDMPRTNRKHKERVFLKLYNNKERLLKLYNAINGTDYDNPEELKIVTLENAIYMSMKNDLAFIIRSELNLYEHQSTKNPNMPLRDLLYIAHEYQKLIDNRELFWKKPMSIPAPRFLVLYNGKDEVEDRFELKLSDLYNPKVEDPELELKVTVLNINLGHNEELMHRCTTLNEYAMYVDRVRSYQRIMTSDEAVRKAVNECIEENILKEFLTEQKEEVIAMSIFEYDEEAVLDYIRQKHLEEGHAEGRAEGRAEGKAEGKAKEQIRLVINKVRKNKTLAEIADALEVDEEVIKPIYEAVCASAPDYDVDKIYELINN